jgi:hypothetical protein
MDVPPAARQHAAVSSPPSRSAPGTESSALPSRGAQLLGKAFAGILARSRARGEGRGEAVGAAVPQPPLGKGAAPSATTQAAPAERGPIPAEKGDDGEAGAPRGPRDDARDLELLDPASRHAASLAPPLTTSPSLGPAAATEAPLRARSLEELLPALVRRIAWAGDKHKGTVSLELGAGSYAGTTVVVHADGGRVRVEISGSEGPELDRLRARLDGRLRSHGLDVESVT